jgi:type IV pilus assembly protein PilB
MIRKEFADLLSNTGILTLKSLKSLLVNKELSKITEFKLLELKEFDETKLAQVSAQKYKIPFMDLSKANIPNANYKLLKKMHVIKYRSIVLKKENNISTITTFDPTIMSYIDEVSQILRTKVEMVLTTLSSWKSLYENIESSAEELIDSIEEVKSDNTQDQNIGVEEIGDDIITYVNRILAEAYVKKASDIHIEPYEKVFRVRIRVDGSLMKVESPPKSLMLPIISRVKIMADMDIAEKRKPQDGRIKLLIGGKPIDYRVSSLPTLFGEKVVLRLLDSSNLQLDMTKLGFEKNQITRFLNGIHQPYGMALVTGPTGSGKTTTLYSALADLNKIHSNISTVEDPVEFNLEGINQVNVRKDIGLTFASALKSFLRQDPDIIMLGEIRDLETGEIAVEAALTGHLVLSTLHTNDAPSTVTRILNMGIEPFLVVAALNVVVAQRLCRKICDKCKVLDKAVTVQEIIGAGVAPKSAQNLKVYKGSGCNACNNSGYKGRVAVYEVLTVTPKVREIILKNGSADEIKKNAIREGMKTLRMSALTKVYEGQTTLDEAIARTASDKS